ncbi:DUF72 domain-containing protein [Bdellovibrio svalbardensis]|uniref:DUF72 domain-containing protein n=1 Tax=Bdellovibrio svalbardensis TaxID=2972972 RepID=A0ABT6DLE2_9BACT|nr:DUF72 domain-containing protein [Bdellovibrio svalbardensis]MDG0817633.1 DUF72 domain-containing protein [Bdellovibrio svalbardensis]
METRIGISGWRYSPWRGEFYPKDLVQKDELSYASRQVSSIEINGTFYATQSPSSYKNWFQATPEDFRFSVKGPRYITHVRRLHNVRQPLANFFASGVLHLRQKLGPFLWQFSPSFRFDEERIEEFFKMLPRTFKEAALLAQTADRFEADFPEDALTSSRPLRHAMEVRHHSFENPDFIKLLRKYNIALVLADTAGKWPYMEDVTSDFMYLRLHGDEELYASGYDEPTLNWWADRIKLWRKGREPLDALDISDEAGKKAPRDVFVYFDNNIKIRAPSDAKSLMRILKA